MKRIFVIALLLVVSATPAAYGYAPALTPDLVRAASVFYFQLGADNIPYPAEWSQALPDHQGLVMVVTPFIRLAMGLSSDEFIANHAPASTLNPAVVERLNQYFQDTLLLYVELAHTSQVPPDPPQVQVLTADGKTLTPRRVAPENRPRMQGEAYATRFFVEFALSDGIRPTDTIRVFVRPAGRAQVTLTFNLARMR